jgi:sialate O-acetylesterase
MKQNPSLSCPGIKTLFSVFLMLLFVVPAFAVVKLPGVLTSNMVLQRNKEIKVWGWADKSEKVSVTFNNKSLNIKADKAGKWLLTFPAMKEGGPYTMSIKGKNSIILENILIGDVWVCSGQSNMEWIVKNTNNSAKEIASADYPQIRLITIPKNFQFAPAEDVKGMKWNVCSPETVGSFSAVGYYFGRDVYKEVGVPIGLINTSWGGTNVEAWTSGDFITKVEEFKDKVEFVKAQTPEEMEAARQKKIDGIYSRFGLDPTKSLNTDTWNKPGIDLAKWEDIDVPGLWEAKGIGEVDGVMWFRKEVLIPANLATKDWNLLLGKIDDNDKTYINGKLVGETSAYNDLREYDVKAGTFSPGINLIAVRVEDTGGGGGFWGAKEDMKLECGDVSISLDGIWKCRLSLESLIVDIGNNNPNATPSSLYNGMINPLLNLAVTGAIWYQGESNASKAYQYRTLFPLMIECWRAKWNQPDLHFFFVQLANFMTPDAQPVESEWAELREAQTMTLSLPCTGMAVTTDIGEEKDIHPKNKQDVGYRLALQALKTVYGKPVIKDGPVYKSMNVDGNRVTLTFDTDGGKLVAKDKYGYLKGFAIAGADKKFYWARARMRDGKVTVSSEMVESPVAVRYAWGNNPDDANLYNEEGLPASSFRTDDWPGITFEKK